jgi:hypothetical protein
VYGVWCMVYDCDTALVSLTSGGVPFIQALQCERTRRPGAVDHLPSLGRVVPLHTVVQPHTSNRTALVSRALIASHHIASCHQRTLVKAGLTKLRAVWGGYYTIQPCTSSRQAGRQGSNQSPPPPSHIRRSSHEPPQPCERPGCEQSPSSTGLSRGGLSRRRRGVGWSVPGPPSRRGRCCGRCWCCRGEL